MNRYTATTGADTAGRAPRPSAQHTSNAIFDAQHAVSTARRADRMSTGRRRVKMRACRFSRGVP